MWVYSRYITKNGVRIYPKNARFFRFWVDDEKKLPADAQLSLTEGN